MSSRLHNKFHRHNHHTASTNDPRFPDASYDPIASYSSPFQGPLVVTNPTAPIPPPANSSGVSNAATVAVDAYGDINTSGNMYVAGRYFGDGSQLAGIRVTSIVGLSGSPYEFGNANPITSIVTTLTGTGNLANAQYSIVASGLNNQVLANGNGSFIASGSGNQTNYSNTFILGSNIIATQPNYTYVNNLSTQGIVATTDGNSNNWNTAYTNSTALRVSYNTLSSTQAYVLTSNNNILPVLGNNNTVSSLYNYPFYSNIGGGKNNTISGYYSTVAGGCSNRVCAFGASVGGGSFNTAAEHHSTVSGGVCNTASWYYTSVAGGLCNTASGYIASVGGGRNNTASGWMSHVAGGCCNRSSGCFSAILAGSNNNTNNQACSFIVGQGITAPQPNYTYVNNISSVGVVAASGGNSNQWNTAYSVATTYQGASSTFLTNIPASLSGNWQSTYLTVSALSGSWGTAYTLPTASTTILGGVKVDGKSITITNGVITAQVSGIQGNYLSLSGGTLTGTLSAPTINTTTITINSQVQYLSAGAIKVYQYYNTATNSLDTVFV